MRHSIKDEFLEFVSLYFSEIRRDCKNIKCKIKNCVFKNINDIFSGQKNVVTFVSNLHIMEKYGFLPLFKDKKIIFDNIEYLDRFFDENLESFKFSSLSKIIDNLEKNFTLNGSSNPHKLSSLFKRTKKYMNILQSFLREEFKNEKYRVAISKKIDGYDDLLCKFLDLFINISNLNREILKDSEKYSAEFWYIDYCRKLEITIDIMREIFNKSNDNIKYLQLFDDDIKIFLNPVELSKPFIKLIDEKPKQFIIITGVGDNREFRKYLLNSTGLDRLGEFEYIGFHKYSNIDMIVREDNNELNSKDKNYLKRFKELIIKTIKSRGGRTLVIMNSMARMKNLSTLLEKEPLVKELLFLQQHSDGGKNKIIRLSKNSDYLLILGSQSFYTYLDCDEGKIDNLIVEKPPFPFFGDDFISARRDLYSNRGFDDFNDFIVPHTILKLKNRMKRLSQNGVVIIADNKISSNNYFNFIENTISPANIYKSLESYTIFR